MPLSNYLDLLASRANPSPWNAPCFFRLKDTSHGAGASRGHPPTSEQGAPPALEQVGERMVGLPVVFHHEIQSKDYK